MAQVLIFDTNILIDYLLGVAEAKAFWSGIPWEDRYTTAISIMELYQTLSHGQLLADRLIAAIALLRGTQLITGNSRHFAYIPGLDILVPPYRSSGS